MALSLRVAMSRRVLSAATRSRGMASLIGAARSRPTFFAANICQNFRNRPSQNIVVSGTRQLRCASHASGADLLSRSNWESVTSAYDQAELAPLKEFVLSAIELCKPDSVHLVTGSEDENSKLLALLQSQGTLEKLSDELRPNSYAARSDPEDVKRSMGDTFICSIDKKDAGPINNWVDPKDMKSQLKDVFDGCMQGRTMYITPMCMGPVSSPAAKFCIQVTDSPYVVVHLKITTRMGLEALNKIVGNDDYIQCWHSVGCPILEENATTDAGITARSSWPCNIPERKIVHFPETREVWSFGSGYGGNALLGKKCVALRIASVQGRDEGWLAEHMLILGITSPSGEKRYMCGAFPSACGKTNLSMLESSLPGWKVEIVGDDIAWLRFDKNGQLRAVNPENGMFGVAPGTAPTTNPNAIKTFSENSIFTNVATTQNGDVYWEGLGAEPDCAITDWHGNPWTPDRDGGGPSSHPNSRFTTPLSQCPSLDSHWDNPEGVPIDAIVFGTRRDNTMPLVFESFDWEHGVFIGASMRSNATSAAEQVGVVHDPMAMAPFIGYNVKDYFSQWLSVPALAKAAMGSSGTKPTLPKIFHVNWFARNEQKDFIWPGFTHNARVLAWIVGRCSGQLEARETPIGLIPEKNGIDLSGMSEEGLDFSESDLESLLAIDEAEWRKELEAVAEYFNKDLMSKDDTVPVPDALVKQLANVKERFQHATNKV